MANLLVVLFGVVAYGWVGIPVAIVAATVGYAIGRYVIGR